VSAVALLIRQAWQNGLVPGSVATLLDEPGILTEKAEDVRNGPMSIVLESEPDASSRNMRGKPLTNSNVLNANARTQVCIRGAPGTSSRSLTMREYLRVLILEAHHQIGMVLQHRAIRRIVLLPIFGVATFHEILNE
jgi:hypothetical protein